MNPDDTPTSVLREEHRLIRGVVDALDRILDGADPHGPPLEDLRACVIFFRSFADACHHGKEEDLLFVELEDQGMPADEGPIAVMRHEHRLGRRLVTEMDQALESLREGDARAWSRVRRSGREYVALMRSHIGKEDGFLFELADEVVTGSACARLCASYRGVCGQRFNGRTKEELEGLARGIVRRAGSPPSRTGDAAQG